MVVVSSRVVASGVAREQMALEWLKEFSTDRVSLLSTLQEVAKHLDSPQWSTYALTASIQRWMNEDLIPEYLMDEDIKRQEQEKSRRQASTFKLLFKKPRRRGVALRIRHAWWAVLRQLSRLERVVNPPVQLIDVTFF